MRNTLGNFASKAIKADYSKGHIIGTSGFVIDTRNEKLFDYGTAGFRFTTRQIAQDPSARPFQVGPLNFVVEHDDATDGEVEWQSKIDNEDWFTEEPITFLYDEGQYSRKRVESENGVFSGHRFQIRLTSMTSNIAIKDIGISIQVLQAGS